MDNLLNFFKIAQFQFILRVVNPLYLPSYKGSTFRGGFGHAFKKVVCVNSEKVCGSCLLKGKCVYSYVFETPPPSNTLKMRKYPFAPHPFVITPPLEEKREYLKDDALCFGLTLIGKSIDYLPYFIYTFDELGRMGIGKGKGKYQLEEVRSRGDTKREETIYSSKDKTLHQNFRVTNLAELLSSFTSNPTPQIITLHFITPTRLKFDGKLSPTLEFHILLRNLLRRVSLLSYFHCNCELNLDFKGIIEKSREIKVGKSNLHWFDWERYSNRQDTKMMMGGFVGSVTFEGNLEQFLPFLLLGEYIHVGKGTSFGLGKYEIVRT
ncbi:MAG: CRISPR system precrRNA processing endoribonuclease RAMP protein Cas6 [Thermodesulfobacteriota bacterium]